MRKTTARLGLGLEGHDGQGERLGHGDALHDEQDRALRVAVGHETGERPEEQHRSELGHGQQPDGEPAVGDLVDQQGHRHERQPVADLRDELAAEEQAEVAAAQRPEHPVAGALGRGGGAGGR